ncbi:hypothetical protein HPT27_02780 [Permianibacter sp. IMCC34836]|uniref:hypothetical protein n=1 Tax=Permianibacter fluminis TaxID=2738515 RepID=UPI0015518E49|nr:hypothetical protein [Permianibacter fluminis]NQD35931.1 hypothetical protein [Permianibacter fluminis]
MKNFLRILSTLLLGLLLAPCYAEQATGSDSVNSVDAALTNIAGTASAGLTEAARQALAAGRVADASFLIQTARLRLDCDRLLYSPWWRDSGKVDELTAATDELNGTISSAIFNAPQEFVSAAQRLASLDELARSDGYSPGWRYDPAGKPEEARTTCSNKKQEIVGVYQKSAELLNRPDYMADWQIMKLATQRRNSLSPEEIKQRNEAMDRMRAIENEKYGKVELMPVLLMRALRGE